MWLEYFEQYFEHQFPQFLSAKPWNYKNDLCVIGAKHLSKATEDIMWLRHIKSAAPYLMREDGGIANWKTGEHNIDKLSFGKSLRILRDMTNDVRYQAAIETAYSFIKEYPRCKTGNFWHKDIYPNQIWLDGFYMAMPFYAKTIAENGDDCWDDIFDQFKSADVMLWNEDKQLYHHGCDVSRKAEWADPITGLNQAFWLRAEGWFFMALVDTYEIAKDYTFRSKELIPVINRAAKGILRYRDEKSEMFFQVIDAANMNGNYPETSGSAMIAYSFIKGARLGMLDKEFAAIGSDIINGIARTYLKRENGELHLYGICASAGLGAGPDPHNRKDRDGTMRYYLSEAQMTDNQHGAAACMMAVSEQLTIKR